ncbi:hypothetical protein M5D96_006236, partial [Drosophila gunungcola]
MAKSGPAAATATKSIIHTKFISQVELFSVEHNSQRLVLIILGGGAMIGRG